MYSLRFLALAVFVLLATRASAAPPALTYLYPAGAQRGKTVEVTAGGTFASWPVRTWASGKGVEVRAAKEKGKLSVTVAGDAEPGLYWVRLADGEGASGLRPFFVGTQPEVNEVEPNDEPKKAQPLPSADVVVNGRLNPANDVDCFAVSLRKGQTLVASLEANRTLGSPMDAHLQILSPDGFVLAESNDFHGLDPQLAFAVPKDGTYQVRTFAFPAVPDASIRFAGGETFVYRLTLTTGGFADHAFPLAVSLKQPAPVELVGWNIPDAAKRITLRPDRVTDHFPVRHPQVIPPVAVRVEAHPTATEADSNGRDKPQAIELPLTVSGRIDPPGDVDVYEFAAKKGPRLTFRIEANSLGSPLNPVLRLTDAAGKIISEAETAPKSPDPEVAFTPPADGRYRVEVRDLYGEGGQRYVYRLRAIPPQPDYALTLATDRFELAPDGSLEIPVTVERRNGFAGPVEVKTEGLPPGVTATPVTSADAAAKSVKLKLAAGKGAASGPFRIVGSAPALSDPMRTARTPIAGLNAQAEDLWLAVVKPKAKAK